VVVGVHQIVITPQAQAVLAVVVIILTFQQEPLVTHLAHLHHKAITVVTVGQAQEQETLAVAAVAVLLLLGQISLETTAVTAVTELHLLLAERQQPTLEAVEEEHHQPLEQAVQVVEALEKSVLVQPQQEPQTRVVEVEAVQMIVVVLAAQVS
jgi:hypothetical protein